MTTKYTREKREDRTKKQVPEMKKAYNPNKKRALATLCDLIETQHLTSGAIELNLKPYDDGERGIALNKIEDYLESRGYEITDIRESGEIYHLVFKLENPNIGGRKYA
jgi:hypothetical protein